MDPTLAVVIVLAIVVLAVLAYALTRRNRTKELHGKFGPEYERAVDRYGDPGKAERDLAARQKRVETLQIRTLTAEERTRYSGAWNEVQARFVDDPRRAVDDADVLVREVMQKRGYPVGDFEQQAADISVNHPGVVEHYRAAHTVAERNATSPASTEELRTALVHYRGLFADLLELNDDERPDHAEMKREEDRSDRR